MRRVLPLIAALALLSGCGTTVANDAPSAAQLQTDLAGSPAPLAALHARANELLSATPQRFRALLSGLRGHPVIVNKWAAWCGPCQTEFPVLQQLGARYGRTIAFVGIDAGDVTSDARKFLGKHPVSYPSYVDPHESLAATVNLIGFYPMTVFLDPQGRTAFIHQGPYDSTAELSADIARYLGVR